MPRRRPDCPRAVCAPGRKLHDVSFELLSRARSSAWSPSRARARTSCSTSSSGSEPPDAAATLLVDGKPVTFRHPADAIRAGLVYVPADRAEALLMQRSVRENIALPFSTRFRSWGLIDLGDESAKVDEAIGTLQIDTRAPGRGPAAVGRQPAEGDDRALGRRRRADDAVLRPDPRDRHPDQAPDLRRCSATWRRPGPRSCSTPPSSRRSSSSAIAPS